MGGFVDPFVPEPAWPQDTMFMGSSWSGTYQLGGPGSAPDQGTQFHLPTVSSSTATGALFTGSAKAEMVVSPVEELHEQFLMSAHLPDDDDVTQHQHQHQQGLLGGFQVDSGGALVAGTLGSLLLSTTPCAISLADSAPVVCCSSNDSSGSEQSRFLLGERQQQKTHAWPPSTFPQISSLVGEETSHSLRFSSNDLLREASCAADAKKYPQLGSSNVPSAPLQLHDDVEFNTGKMMLSFTPGLGQQLNTTSANFGHQQQLSQKEFSGGLHHLNLLSGQQLSSFNATGPTHNPQQSSEVSSGKTGLNTPQLMANANGAAAGSGSGAPKPRVRARRGQATDPHSIAERLRREKISDRMKNLQELVPNSNRTDKASMLEEIIEYVKFLQLQVKVLSMSRLGATEAVVPLLTESQTESSGGLLLSPSSGSGSGRPRAGRGNLSSSPPPEVRDGAAFEREVAQLMESNMTTAMQYLQSKGLCLMPIALASAISDQKGAENAGAAKEMPAAENAGAAKEMLRAAVKPLGSPIQGR